MVDIKGKTEKQISQASLIFSIIYSKVNIEKIINGYTSGLAYIYVKDTLEHLNIFSTLEFTVYYPVTIQ